MDNVWIPTTYVKYSAGIPLPKFFSKSDGFVFWEIWINKSTDKKIFFEFLVFSKFLGEYRCHLI